MYCVLYMEVYIHRTVYCVRCTVYMSPGRLVADGLNYPAGVDRVVEEEVVVRGVLVGDSLQ